MTNFLRALAVLLAVTAVAAAQAPVAKPAAATPATPQPVAEPAKPAAAPAPAEPTDVKTFTFASDAEFADMNQQFGTLFGKVAAKGTKAPKFTAIHRAKSVLVRGTKAELDAAEAVVKLIQGTAGADAKGPQITKLKNARADEIVGALSALELEGAVLPLRGSNTLIVLPGADASVQQVKKVIEAFEKIDPKTVKTAGTVNND